MGLRNKKNILKIIIIVFIFFVTVPAYPISEKELENSKNNRFWINKGADHFYSGQYKEAVRALKEAIKIKPAEETYFMLGLVCSLSNMHEEAIEALEQTLKLNPDHADAYYCLGITYGKLEMYAYEIESYKQALKINPDYANIHYNLGAAYLLINDKTSALEEYKILKTLNLKLAEKLLKFINIYIKIDWNKYQELSQEDE